MTRSVSHTYFLRLSNPTLFPCLMSLLLVFSAYGLAEDDATQKSTAPAPIEAKGIENLFRLSPRLYSGGQPEGEAAFERLKQLGVRTIITVDGARPDVELARRFGMRYVHLPIGYDAVPAEKAVKIAKVQRELPGPVFVHCHHGKHRGPAAAAFCAIATEGWSREQGLEWMQQAGTSPDYRGLFQSVRSLPIPTADQLKALPAEFPETASVSTIVESMVEVDRHWDRLKADRDRKFAAPDDKELTPAQVALQLSELFHELARSDETDQHGRAFAAAATEARKSTEGLQQALRKLADSGAQVDRDAVESRFKAVAQSCTSCHRKYRDSVDRNKSARD